MESKRRPTSKGAAVAASDRLPGPGGASAVLGQLAPSVVRRLATLDAERVVERTWARDHTLFVPTPAETSDRLGWLTSVDDVASELDGLMAFAGECRTLGFASAVLLGIGGSSLGAEVLHATLGSIPSALSPLTFRVVDASHPRDVAACTEGLDLSRTLFIVASKSGSTIETRCQLDHFLALVGNARQFAAITDPGSDLERFAREQGFLRVFLNQPDIGGRYSIFSRFGMVPAAVAGIGLSGVVSAGREMAGECRESRAASNPGAWLGAILGEAALHGRDKLTFVLDDALAAFGPWVEQLVAESTGKHGRGILPVEAEPIGQPDVYGDDRVFVALGEGGALGLLEDAGHPVVRIPGSGRDRVGTEFFRWEFATAIACHVLGVNPFDQPNVQEAKERTAAILGGVRPDAKTMPASLLLAGMGKGDYLAVTAFLPRTMANREGLQAARVRLRDRLRVATTIGFGPRFLHSTGQLHKGGPPTGVVVQVVDDDRFDLPIAGRRYTFGDLNRAQALGDLAALAARGRRIARVTPGELMRLSFGN